MFRTSINRYLAHGTATDYMYDIARVPMAFTFEVCEIHTVSYDFYVYVIKLTNKSPYLYTDWQIYGDKTASLKDCFKMFNPVDHTTFNVCCHI